MRIDIEPIGKPRQTRSDVWKKRPVVVRYRQFCDDLREAYQSEFPNEVHLVFGISMPDSWSKKKKFEMLGKPHQQRPDIDNISKSVLDALLKEDSCVHTIFVKKIWAEKGFIEINPL